MVMGAEPDRIVVLFDSVGFKELALKLIVQQDGLLVRRWTEIRVRGYPRSRVDPRPEANDMANETPDTPKVSETELRESTADELPQEAKSPDVQGTSKMRKDELVREVARLRSSSDASEDQGQSTDGEPERGPGGVWPPPTTR